MRHSQANSMEPQMTHKHDPGISPMKMMHKNEPRVFPLILTHEFALRV